MRRAEIEYWDHMAKEKVFANGLLADNIFKRPPILRSLLAYSWAREKVLEIGIGTATTAGALRILNLGLWDYTGTDLSETFCEQARKFGLHTVQADVLNLPGEGYSRVIALDSLEHVRPEDREKGYSEIVRVMKERGVLFINIPLSESAHDGEFDHGFDLSDLHRLEKAGLSLENYDTYEVFFQHIPRKYAMAVMHK